MTKKRRLVVVGVVVASFWVGVALAAEHQPAQPQKPTDESALPQEESEPRSVDGEPESRLDWRAFLRAFSKYYTIGNLVVAEFEHMGKIAVGHKTLGFELTLPYAPDWKFTTSETEPLYGSSTMLGVSVSVTTLKGVSEPLSCMDSTRKEIPAKGRMYEKTNNTEPVLWRYERNLKERLFEYNLWTFKTQNNTCFRYRLSILTDHSPSRSRFVNRMIRYVASFQTHFRERVREIERRRKAREKLRKQSAPTPEPQNPTSKPDPKQNNER